MATYTFRIEIPFNVMVKKRYSKSPQLLERKIARAVGVPATQVKYMG